MDISEAVPFIAFLFLVYLIILSEANFWLLVGYAFLLEFILAAPFGNESHPWSSAILPGLALAASALSAVSSVLYFRHLLWPGPGQERTRAEDSTERKPKPHLSLAALTPVFFSALYYHHSSFRLTVLSLFLLLNSLLLVALSPLQALISGVRPSTGHGVKPLDVVHPANHAHVGSEEPATTYIDAELVIPEHNCRLKRITLTQSAVLVSLPSTGSAPIPQGRGNTRLKKRKEHARKRNAPAKRSRRRIPTG